MPSVRVNYLSRDFQTLRQDLINFAKTYHPDKFAYFNDASPDMMYLEMVAYVGDMLSYYTDKTFNESFLSTAQAREALVRIANDLGFFDTGATPSSTQVVLSITVPRFVDTVTGIVKPDPELLVGIEPGMQLTSDSGVSFEILEEVNFADERNRKVIPNLDGSNSIIDYTIEKTAIAKAGSTKIQRYFVADYLAKPFLNITLDDVDITEIIGVVSVSGSQFIAPPDADFIDPDKAYFEVRSLTQETKFVEINPLPTTTSSLSSYIEPVVKQGSLVAIPKRFIARRDVNDLVSLTFGSSSPSYSAFNTLIETSIDPGTVSFNQVLQNTSLGEIPPPNSTLFIKYRIGGGKKTDIVAGQLNTIGSKSFVAAPTSTNPNFFTLLQQVRNSLAVRNDIPAMGGKDIPTNEEIRSTAGKIFAAQDRGVTYEDIKALINTMPSRFGKPFRLSYEEIKPRVANFSQVRGGVDFFLNEILTQSTQVARQQKAQELQAFLFDLQNGIAQVDGNNIPSTLDALSLELLGSTPTLWLGEKARLYTLGIAEDGRVLTAFKNSSGVWVSPNEQLKKNIREFLLEKRIIGDWIDIVDGRVANITVEFTIMVDKKNKQAVLVEALNKMRAYFDTTNWQMNQPIFISNVATQLQEINGVINVVDLKFYNIFGVGSNNLDPISGREYATQELGRYRNNSPTPANPGNNKFEMKAPNNIILGYSDTLFEVRYPETDIIGSAI